MQKLQSALGQPLDELHCSCAGTRGNTQRKQVYTQIHSGHA